MGKNFNFFVSLRITEILGFSEFSVYTEVVLLKTFPQHFASTANVEEVMKFYNLDDKTFETDFSLMSNHRRPEKIFNLGHFHGPLTQICNIAKECLCHFLLHLLILF